MKWFPALLFTRRCFSFGFLGYLALCLLSFVETAWSKTQAKMPESLQMNRQFPPQLEAALRGLAGAVLFYEKGEFKASLELLPRHESASNTAIGDYFLLYRAKAFLSINNLDKAIDIFRLLRKEYPSSPLLAEAIVGECQALLKMKKAEEARLLLANSSQAKNAEALFLQAQIEESTRGMRHASEIYLQLYSDYATAKQSQQAFDRLQVISPASLKGSAAYDIMLRRAENLLSAGMSQVARSVLVKLSETSAPNKGLAGKRWMLLAQSEVNLGKAGLALPYLTKAIDSNPALQAQGLYLQAMCYRRLKQEDRFLAMRDRALQLYPDSPFTEKLLHSVATYYVAAEKSVPALIAYRQLLSFFPKGNYAEEALWKVAFHSYVDRKYDEALNSLWKYMQSFTGANSVTASLYWMGRCYEKLSDFRSADFAYTKAAALGQHSYYGHLALQAKNAIQKKRGEVAYQPYAGAASWARVEKFFGTNTPANTNIADPSPSLVKIINRALQLNTAGLPKHAVNELNSAIRQFPEEKGASYLNARILVDQGDYDTAFRVLRRAFPGYDSSSIENLPMEVWQLMYPMKYWREVSKEAAVNKVDPHLVMGLIRQESSFNKVAKSPANARGLMQILPSTGRMLSKSSSIRYTSATLLQPETNIKLGVRHLAGLFRKYEGKDELALAAYNAGESRVTRWINGGDDADLAEFVERIPFSETRNYIKRVLTNASYYRQLNGSFTDMFTQINLPAINSNYTGSRSVEAKILQSKPLTSRSPSKKAP